MSEQRKEIQFVVAEARAGSFSYHVREATSPSRTAVCGDHTEVDTSIPIEAWDVKTDKSIITKWCKRCKLAIAAAAAQAELAKLMPRGGDVVYFSQCRKELNGRNVGFKGAGFGVMLGAVQPGLPEPPPVLVPRLMGEIGYLKFDDVYDFFGKEKGDECVEKFKDKYYGKIVVDKEHGGESTPEREAVRSALQLVDSSGKPIALIPPPGDKQ